jgi:hypothetical protein
LSRRNMKKASLEERLEKVFTLILPQRQKSNGRDMDEYIRFIKKDFRY